MRLPRLHVVTDDAVLAREDLVAQAAGVLEAAGDGVALHVRGPHSPARRIHDTLTALQPFSAASGAQLFVNDRVDIALVARHSDVHLGRRSIPVHEARKLLGSGAHIGLSCHDAAEVERAAPDGADFAFMGTMYATPSHPGRAGLGAEALKEVLGCGVPVVAIGGVSVERVAEVVQAGAHGVAVVSGVWGAADPPRAVEAFVAALAEVTAGG